MSVGWQGLGLSVCVSHISMSQFRTAREVSDALQETINDVREPCISGGPKERLARPRKRSHWCPSI